MDRGFEKLSWDVMGSEGEGMDGIKEERLDDEGAMGRGSGVELVGRMLEMLILT